VPAVEDPRWNLQVPSSCPGVPRELLLPRATWTDPQAYDRAAGHLALRFRDNFARHAGQATDEVRQAGPRV